MRPNTRIIEVEVRGSCGIGKSEVLEVISNALRDFYENGSRTVIAGDLCEGAIDDAKTTKQTAKHKDTIIVLKERMPSE